MAPTETYKQTFDRKPAYESRDIKTKHQLPGQITNTARGRCKCVSPHSVISYKGILTPQHDQLEHDSSQPIVIPGQEIIQQLVPESFQTAQSLEYPFSSSVNSVGSAANGSYSHQFMGSSLRGPFNNMSPTANFSPRADPPVVHPHRVSFTGPQSARPSLLTTKLSQSNITLPPLGQQFNQQGGFQTLKKQQTPQAQHLQAQQQHGLGEGTRSPSQLSFKDQRSDSIAIQQQPSTSAHFTPSGTANSFTPFHNTPSAVSSSYSAPSSAPFLSQAYQQSQYQPHQQAQQPLFQTRGFDTPSQGRRVPPSQTEGTQAIGGTPQSVQYGEPLIASIAGSYAEHLDIVSHPVDDLLVMLSALLQKIIEANDSLHPHHYHHASQMHQTNKYTGNVLAFHGRNVPAISIHAYLTRILKYCPVTNEVFLTLLVYFDRIAKMANTADQEEGEGKEQLFVMDSYNIHRLIIAGITVASKFFSDIFYKNSRYARVGGLPLDELNHLELQFLLLTDFRLLIPIEELQRYADLLLKFWNREQAKKDQPRSQG